jgi:hypothetical protein
LTKKELTKKKLKEKKSRNFIDFNRYNGRKKYFNISTITDLYGTPLEISVHSSKETDSKTLIKNVNNLPTNINTLKNSKNNRYKQYFLGDPGYNTEKNKQFLISKGYTPIIKYNKRNTQDEKIIKENELSDEQKLIYKKRFKVESFFSWIKNYPLINQNYQKKIESYKGLLSLMCSLFISQRI